VWAFAKCNIAGNREQAVGEIKMALAASAHHAFRFTLDGKQVPPELREPIAVLQREYVPAEHEQLGQTRNATLSDELGLTDYLADRFAVVGTPEECREKVRIIQQAGVDVLLITAIGPQPEEIIRRFGEDVIPHTS
jgi:alkanesulfonate monooxygenase SsuD/methylene tetrahydromethanopterin reductase-like flavin-dependent oxidoreductase (luciferase family)